jgi:hypothetical protein
MIKTRLIVFLFLLILFKIDGFDSDDLEKVKAIEAVATRGSRYKLYPAELFDGEMPWKISRGSSFLDTTSFISKTPTTEAYKLESKLYYKEESKTKSMQVYSNIEIPGRDKFFIKPEVSRSLPAGTPSRIFFWVYSNNYAINLRVILSQKKSPDVIVDFGQLKFNGWRRLDAKVNIYKPQERLNLDRFSQFELKGILLESSSFQSKGSFYLFIDQMGILIEKPETYPGSEVPDGWELY